MPAAQHHVDDVLYIHDSLVLLGPLVDEGNSTQGDGRPSSLERCQGLMQDQVACTSCKHGREERQAGQSCEVAAGGVVEEHPIRGCTAQQRDVGQEPQVMTCQSHPLSACPSGNEHRPCVVWQVRPQTCTAM